MGAARAVLCCVVALNTVGVGGANRAAEEHGGVWLCWHTQDNGQQTGLECVEWWRIGWRLFLLLLGVERSVEGGGHGEVC